MIPLSVPLQRRLNKAAGAARNVATHPAEIVDRFCPVCQMLDCSFLGNNIEKRGRVQPLQDGHDNVALHTSTDPLSDRCGFETIAMAVGCPGREASDRRIKREHHFYNALCAGWRADECELAKGFVHWSFVCA